MITLAVFLTIIALLGRMFTIKSVFMSKKKAKAQVDESIQRQFNQNGKESTIVAYIIIFGAIATFNFFFFIITSAVTGSTLMAILAGLMMVKSIAGGITSIKYISGVPNKLSFSRTVRISNFLLSIGYCMLFLLLIIL